MSVNKFAGGPLVLHRLPAATAPTPPSGHSLFSDSGQYDAITAVFADGRASRRVAWQPLLDIRDFGAKVDGLTDDAPAVRAAQAAAVSGQSLYFPTGTCLLGSTVRTSNNENIFVQPKSGVSWVGDGPTASVLKVADGMIGSGGTTEGYWGVLAASQSPAPTIVDVKVSDLGFDLNSANNQHPASFKGTGDYGWEARAIFIGIGSNIIIERCRFSNCNGNHVILIGDFDTTIRMDRAAVLDCEFYNCANDANMMSDVLGDHSSCGVLSNNSRIMRNAIINPTSNVYAFKRATMVELRGSNVQVIGNKGTNYQKFANHSVDSERAKNVKISDNVVDAIVRFVDLWTTLTEGAEHIEISGNIAQCQPGTVSVKECAVGYVNGSSTGTRKAISNLAIRGNKFAMTGLSSLGADGIEITESVYGLTVEANEFVGWKHLGMWLHPSRFAANGTAPSRNRLVRAKIHDNKFIDCGVAQYGILFDGLNENQTIFEKASIHGNQIGHSVFDIIGATNATPIVIQTSADNPFETGDSVVVAGVLGNTAANGTWTYTRIDATHGSLNTSVGSGAYTSGGTANRRSFAGIGLHHCTDDIDIGESNVITHYSALAVAIDATTPYAITQCKVRGQRSAWALGSVAVGAGLTVNLGTVAVNGVNSTVHVRVVPATQNGLIYEGFPSAVDVITVFARNPTGGSLNSAASGTLLWERTG